MSGPGAVQLHLPQAEPGQLVKTRSKGRSCDGKRRHETDAQAHAHIQRLGRMLGAPLNRYHAYTCQPVGGLHVGHHTGKPRRSR